MEMQFVPGLPIPADPTLMPATNDLHMMKTKVTINLILNNDVSPEKEALLKNILTAKLHLDEASGDSIQVGRAKFPEAEVKPPEKPRTLPEFSWKTWGLIVLLALIGFASLIFWLNARNNKKATASDEDKGDEKTKPSDVASRDRNEDDDVVAEAPAAASTVIDDHERELLEIKDQLLFMVSQYPQISSKTVSDLLTSSESEEDVLRTFEYLSWDVSRRIFTGVSPRVWGKLGLRVRARTTKPTALDYKESLQRIYRSILARFLEAGAEKDDDNPFAFVYRLSTHERKQLLGGETAGTFAMISLYADTDELQSLMEVAPPAMQEKLVIEIAKLQSLPEATLTRLALSLKERLKAIKAAPSVFADGPGLAAKLLRSYTPERELEIYDKMRLEDPKGADAVRRLIAQFDDIPYYPAELVSSAAALLEIEELVKALFNSAAEHRSSVLSVMPPKRAKMVERDLESSGFNVRPADIALGRRLFAQKIEKVLESRGQSISTLWQEMDRQNGTAQLRVA
jgi:flagellar motor switch protein FliG